MATDVEQTISVAPNAAHEETLAWLAANPGLLSGYEGQWVAFDGRRIVAHDASMPDVVRKARDLGVDDPFLVPVLPAGYIIA